MLGSIQIMLSPLTRRAAVLAVGLLGFGFASAGATTATAAEQPPMVAIGDSFTAAFGYFGDGTEMGITDIVACKPTWDLNDGCSSNSPNRKGTGELAFLDDYGYANDRAWPAKVAKAAGVKVKQYRNFAVTGSSATDWFSGKMKPLLDQTVDLQPSTVLMTLGGNPTLGEMLFGADSPCRQGSDAGPKYKACVAELVRKAGTPSALTKIYKRLLSKTKARVLVVHYPTIIPAANLYTVEQLVAAGQVLNDTIDAAAHDAREALPKAANRLEVIEPPAFHIGLPPGNYECKGWIFTSRVDGPSHQATVTQTLERALNPRTFCPGDPWVISADTGIHPNATGYAEIAKVVKPHLAADTARRTATGELGDVTDETLVVGDGTVHVEEVSCKARVSCKGTLTVTDKRSVTGGTILARARYSIPGGSSRRVRLRLTRQGRALVRSNRVNRVTVRHHRHHPDGRTPLALETLRLKRLR
jgi:lysophospholipase L1-like esterase